MRAKKLRAHWCGKMTPVGFEPTQLALVELESTPLDHSGKVSLVYCGPPLDICPFPGAAAREDFAHIAGE